MTGFNADAVPAELRDFPQWVVWKAEPRNGKVTKIPFNARRPRIGASTTDPGTWATFEEAVAVAGAFDGIGFVFTENDPYAGVDLDELNDDARRIVRSLASYTERSVSGRGVHVLVRAKIDTTARRRSGWLEVYDRGRYFVVTGAHLTGTPATIEERQAQLLEVLAKHLPEREHLTSDASSRATPAHVDLDDRELVERAMRATNGAAFARLWAGDTAGYPSQSEAELALCSRLAFWTGRDPVRIDRLYRVSGLARPKWDTARGETTYGAVTIANAIEGTTSVYQGSRPGRDAVGTRSGSAPSENGETSSSSPRPDVEGTRDGGTRTSSFSDGAVGVVLRFVPAAEFAAENEPGADALVGDGENILVPENGDVMFYGDGGAGKTTLMIDLSVHLAAGDKWLGVDVGRGVRVGIVENEGPRPLFRKKLRRKLAGWAGSPIDDRLLLLEDPWSKVSIDYPSVREALAKKIAEHKLEAVVIGPVTRSGMNEAGTLQQVRDYVDLLAEVRELSGRRVTFLLAHHENRGGQVSGAWEGAVDTLFHVQAQGNGQTRLFVQKARWSPTHHKQKLQLAWADGESFRLLEEEERDDNTVADEILKFVLEHGGTGWSRVEVAGKGDRLRTIRDNLLAGGRLVNLGTPERMKLWHADDPAKPADEQTRLDGAAAA